MLSRNTHEHAHRLSCLGLCSLSRVWAATPARKGKAHRKARLQVLSSPRTTVHLRLTSAPFPMRRGSRASPASSFKGGTAPRGPIALFSTTVLYPSQALLLPRQEQGL